jgi:hypothetical protein
MSAAAACRVCGCTDDDCSGCVERTGEPCHWVEPDLCSACVGVKVTSKLSLASASVKITTRGARGTMRVVEASGTGPGAVRALSDFVGEQLAAPPLRRTRGPRRKK